MDVQLELPIQWYFFTDIYTELGLGKKGRVRERTTRFYPDDISCYQPQLDNSLLKLHF